MRTLLVSILLPSLLAFAIPACAEEATNTPAAGIEQSVRAPKPASDWTIDTSVTMKSGRDFMDQGFTFTENAVVQLDITACKDDWCFDLWRADTRKKSEHETDFQVWKNITVGTGSIQLKAAYYELSGPNVPEVKFTYRHPLSDTCDLAGSYEHLWHGFKETVLKAKGSCTWKVSERVSIDAFTQITHTKNFDQWVPGAEIGASTTLGNDLRLRSFVRGFGGRDPDVFFGVSLSRSFGN